ncbi:uncharacterized protein stbd1 [Festucalex cinctus]
MSRTCSRLQQQEAPTRSSCTANSNLSWQTPRSLAHASTRAPTDHVTSRLNDLSSTMAFKGSNGVAVERRADLASLFCMIGRHGPAVALAVFAMVSVLAGFVIYRTVRGRRKKKAPAGETDRGEGTSPHTEAEEAVTQAGLEPQACAASTDVDDVAKEDDDPTSGTPFQVRRRIAAKSLSPCSSDIQAPFNQPSTSPHTQRVKSVPSSFTEAQLHLEEPSQSVGAEIQVEPATVCHLYTTDAAFNDEGISEGSLKEPESNWDQICQEQVCDTERQEDIAMNTDEDKAAQEEENARPLSSNLRLEQTLPLRDDLDKQDDETTGETGTVEYDLEDISTDKSPKNDFVEVIHHQHGADPNVYSYDHLAPEVGQEHAVINQEQEKDDGHSSLANETTAEDLDDTAVDFEAQSPQLDPEILTDRKDERSLTSEEEMDLLPDESGLVESCSIVGRSEYVGSSVPFMVDHDMPGITSETTSQIDLNVQDETPMPSDGTDSGITEKGPTTTEGEAHFAYFCEPHILASHQDRQSVQELDNIVSIIPKPASDKDHYDNLESKAFEEPRFDSAGERDAREDSSREDMVSSIQDQRNDQNVDFSSVVSAPPPVMIEDKMNPPKLQIRLPLFEPSDLRDENIYAGGEESGISSMAVSPESLDPGSNFGTIEIPVIDHESQAEAQTCLWPDDATRSILEKDVVAYEPHPAPLPEQPCGPIVECANVEPLAENEGMFGRVIEEGNQRKTDKFTVPVRSDELEKQADVKVSEVSGDNKKLECKENKGAPMEKDEDFVKTEINIMEATMDHNEWITDGNLNFPWMNLAVPSFGGEIRTVTQQLPTEESSHPDSEPQSVPQVNQTDGCDFEANKSKKVNVTFRVHYITRSPFQNLAVTGNRRELGNWKEFIPLESAEGGYWAAVVSLPAGNYVQWKFVVVEKGAVCRWEECGNRLLDTGCGKDLLVHKVWGFL